MEPSDSTRFEQCGELLKHAKDEIRETPIENLEKAANNCFEKAFILAKEQEDRKQEIEKLMKLADACKLDNQFQRALKFYKTVLEIAEGQKDKNREKMAKKVTEERPNKNESSELWEWKKISTVHRKKFIKLHEYRKTHPEDIKEVNGVRICCSMEFLIGKGRDGTRVYVGLDKDGHERAVKRLPKDICTGVAEQEKKVSDELNVQLCGKTKSNYLVNYLSLDSNSDKEFLFLIMDLCEETLEDFVRRSSLDELVTTAPDIIRQILKGLADLHNRGPTPILHRDVQPSNILRDVHGNWLLADFGISRILSPGSNTHQSKNKEVEGFVWKAVESSYPSDGTSVRYKKESDIQVAGMVAFYVVTKGQHPFGEKPDQPRNLLDGKPVGLETLKDSVLKDLLSWMLSHYPNDRPSAEEALKHPYLQPKKQQFKMLSKIGKKREIQMQDDKSHVVRQLNSDPADWKKQGRNEMENSESADLVQEIAAPSSETKQKHEESREKNSWFKNTFLDSTRKLKEEVHEDLKSFPWFCGAFGLARSNKKIPHLHLFLTVKRGTKKSVVRRDLKDKFKCDAKEYFRLLQEPKRKPRMKYLADSSGESSASPIPSVFPSPGGGVLACISGNPVTDNPESGTLTIFCYKNGHHYALTCFHVGWPNDETRFDSTFNINGEDIQKIRNSLPAYVFHAREKRYWFTEHENDNEPIAYEDDLSNYTPLGDFHNSHFDSECDIMSVKVPEDTEINCEMADVTSQDWQSIWDKLLEKFGEWDEGQNPVQVEKIGFSSGLTYGRIVACDIGYGNLFEHAIAVKGYSDSFLENGDSGSPVFFHDKNNQKQVFAYGAYEVDELLLPEEPESTSPTSDENASLEQTTSSDDDDSDDVCEVDDVLPPEQPESTSSTSHENASPEQTTSSDDNDSDDSPWEVTFDEESENSSTNVRGPYFICLRLDTALEKLGFDKACINDCGRN